MPTTEHFTFRAPQREDINELLDIELAAFTTDHLNRRRMRHWIMASGRAFLVCQSNKSGDIAGYILIFYRKDRSTARLYSIAISPRFRGQGLARQLLIQGEALATESEHKKIRLEVRPDNLAAIALYQSLGYQQFGLYPGFYEDGQNALRFEKMLTP